MSRLLVLLGLLAWACGAGAEPAPPPPPIVDLDAGEAIVLEVGRLTGGPAISGTLEADLEATARAEVSGTVTEVAVERGTAVTSGQLLVRFHAPELHEAVRSARSAVHSAAAAEQLAAQDAERTARLAAAGALPRRDAESARTAAASARSVAADARSRLATAQVQLRRATVRAPFAGVVSSRDVQEGDVVQPGTALVTVLDPATMRLSAAVSPADIGEVQLGQPVEFHVVGYGERGFKGAIDRISPATDAATGLVGVSATLPNAGGALIAGLHAEGRVVTRAAEGVLLPLEAIDRSGQRPTVLRLTAAGAWPPTVERVEVVLGLVDEAAEAVLVHRGVRAGDVVLLGGARELEPGTQVRLAGQRRAER